MDPEAKGSTGAKNNWDVRAHNWVGVFCMDCKGAERVSGLLEEERGEMSNETANAFHTARMR